VAALRLLKDAVKAYTDRSGVPYRERLRMTRLGFSPESYVVYELDRNDPYDYAPTRLGPPLYDTNGPTVTALLTNKLLFWQTFKAELPMPRVLALAANRTLMPVAEREARSVDALLALLAEGPLVLKPVTGQKGKRVRLLSLEGGEPALDGAPATRAEVEAALFARDGMLVVEFARQAAYADAIFPHSTNTIRVVMFGGEGAGGEPFVGSLCHRFGTRATAPVDNMSSGGIMGRLDPASHRLGPACTFPFGASRLVWHSRHPDTGAPIEGTLVPGVAAVVERLTGFMRAHPAIAYVGWDVVITADGFTVIEGNRGAGIQTQMFGFPFGRDERIVAFLAHHGLAHLMARRPGGAKPGVR